MHSQGEEEAERRQAHPLSTVFGPETGQDVDCECRFGTGTVDMISGEPANDPRAVAAFERGLIVRLHDRVVDAGDTVTYTATIRTRVRCDEDGLVMFERGGRPVLAAPHEPCDVVIVEAHVCFEKRSLQGSAIA